MSINQTAEQYESQAFPERKPSLLARLRRRFAAPVFEDEEKTRVARLLHTVLMSMLVGALVLTAAITFLYGLPNTVEEAFTPLAALVLIIVIGGLLMLAHLGHVEIASAGLSTTLWLIVTFWNHTFTAQSTGSNNAVYILIIVLAGLLLGKRGAAVFTVLSLLAVASSFAEEIISDPRQELVFEVIITLLVIGLTGVLLGYAVNSLARALDLARRNERALAERSRELEASQRVTFAASERTSPDELLGLVVNLIRDQFDLYHVQVYIVDEEQQMAVLRKSTGYAGRQLLQRNHQIPLGHPALVTRAIHEGQPVLVVDVNQDPNFLPNPLLPDTRSELVVPLKMEQKVIGALDVQGRTPGRFTESTAALFQTMVDQVAFLFENSYLLERISKQTEELTIYANQLRTAAEIAGRLGTILDPERLLQEVVSLLHSRFGLYHAHVYTLDEEAQQLVIQAGSGEVGRVLKERSHNIPLDREQSLVARAVRTQETIVVNDTKLEPDFMPNPLLPDTRSEISMPLMAGNKVLGVLDVQDDQPGRFTESDVDTFSTLAGQVAVALQNAGLFEQVEKNLLETQVRLGVSRALTVAQTEEEVLDVIIQKAGLYPQAQVMLFTIDQEIEEMTVVARRSESFNSGLASLLQPEMRFPASQFQLIQHVEPDKPFISSNIFMDERVDPATREMASQIGTTSMAIFPLIAGNELIGSMAVASKEESFFDERKLHLYQTLALQGGTVLHTARLYDETQRTAARLREVDRLKSEFLANMSHELRTPLNSIIGYAEIMLLGLDGEMDSEIFEDVQAIYDNSHHLLRLINDVLDLAKIEAGRLTLNFEPVEIKSLIDEVSSSTAGLLVNKPVEMIIEVEETLPSIQGDRLRLNQILNNIVSNAAKFTEKGSITLHAYADCSDEADPSDQSDNGWVCIEIQDTGIGISEADQEKIFERFQQVDGSSARRVEGTGLGLAITRHLVELHNGEIELQSQLGQGSTFTVRLPALRQTAESKVNVESV